MQTVIVSDVQTLYSGSDVLKPADCDIDNGLCGWTLVAILWSVEEGVNATVNSSDLVEWLPNATDGKRMVNTDRMGSGF